MPSPDTLAALLRLLERMERDVASRVGAGVPTSEAVRADRWRRELRVDVAGDDGIAGALLEAIGARLAGATTARDVHGAFRAMRAGVSSVSPEALAS